MSSDDDIKRLSVAFQVLQRHSVGKNSMMSIIVPWTIKVKKKLNLLKHAHPAVTEDVNDLHEAISELKLMVEDVFSELRLHD